MNKFETIIKNSPTIENTRNDFYLLGCLSFFIFFAFLFNDTSQSLIPVMIRAGLVGLAGSWLSYKAYKRWKTKIMKWGFYYSAPFWVVSLLTIISEEKGKNPFPFWFYTALFIYCACCVGAFYARIRVTRRKY